MAREMEASSGMSQGILVLSVDVSLRSRVHCLGVSFLAVKVLGPGCLVI